MQVLVKYAVYPVKFTVFLMKIPSFRFLLSHRNQPVSPHQNGYFGKFRVSWRGGRGVLGVKFIPGRTLGWNVEIFYGTL